MKRFGISSFIYRARRPFHPGRLYDVFLEPHFFFHGSMKEEAEEIEKLGLETRQRNAAAKHSKRWQHNFSKTINILQRMRQLRLSPCYLKCFQTLNGHTSTVALSNFREKLMGGLMRSKGFVWIATSQFFMGAWQQAGNVLRIKPAR